MNIQISITKEGEPPKQIFTSTYLVAYFSDGKMKVVGDLDLKDIGPSLFKMMAERLAK